MSLMRKNISEYKTYIVDMDGTLYYQTMIRICMSIILLKYYIVRPWKIKDIFVIMLYRKIREKSLFSEADDIEKEEYSYIAKKMHISNVEYVKKLVEHWMIDRPLAFIEKYRDAVLIAFLKKQQLDNCEVILYSDNPIKEKAKILCMENLSMFCSKDSCIKCYKPDPKGIRNIIKVCGLDIDNTLLIGDRWEKDGKCAEACAMDYVILSKYFMKRKKTYRLLGLV